MNNLELDGFFSTDSFVPQEDYDDFLSEEYNNLYSDMFSSRASSSFYDVEESDDELGTIEEGDIYTDIDYDNFNYQDSEDEDFEDYFASKPQLKSTFEDLPMEIKALLLTDGLKRKDD